MFPQIKIRSSDVDDIQRVRQLKNDLKQLKCDILSYAPSKYNSGKLDRIRIRIFKFSREEGCNEFFIINGNRKYVCFNSSLFNKRYYASLLYTLHGIAHSFCHLKDEVAEESFCEFVSYSILKKFLTIKGQMFSRRIIRGIMNNSPKEYNIFYRAARKLERKNKGIILKLNTRAKNRKISKKKERRIFYRLMKFRKLKLKEDDWEERVLELERGFKKI